MSLFTKPLSTLISYIYNHSLLSLFVFGLFFSLINLILFCAERFIETDARCSLSLQVFCSCVKRAVTFLSLSLFLSRLDDTHHRPLRRSNLSRVRNSSPKSEKEERAKIPIYAKGLVVFFYIEKEIARPYRKIFYLSKLEKTEKGFSLFTPFHFVDHTLVQCQFFFASFDASFECDRTLNLQIIIHHESSSNEHRIVPS